MNSLLRFSGVFITVFGLFIFAPLSAQAGSFCYGGYDNCQSGNKINFYTSEEVHLPDLENMRRSCFEDDFVHQNLIPDDPNYNLSFQGCLSDKKIIENANGRTYIIVTRQLTKPCESACHRSAFALFEQIKEKKGIKK